jgi:Ca-activated chloride channel family protein
MPFGVRHDNPLYAIGDLSAEEMETLKLFADFIKDAEIQQKGTELGFNRDDSYVSTVTQYSGGMISTVLEFWQTEKASGKQIVTVFIADTSGSMEGSRIRALKDSLKTAMQFVGEESKVALINYDSSVYVDLPIGEFNQEQQEYFVGAIDGWRAGGNTATNDAILVAIRLINEEKALNPDIKPIIILLSDGQTCAGYSLGSMKELIDFYDIPIYTIGYEADVAELERIAAINDGAFIDASSDDISYILKTLFDAET